MDGKPILAQFFSCTSCEDATADKTLVGQIFGVSDQLPAVHGLALVFDHGGFTAVSTMFNDGVHFALCALRDRLFELPLSDLILVLVLARRSG
jgi:hypothetical protein